MRQLLRALARAWRRLRFRAAGHRFDHVPGVMGQWPAIHGPGRLQFAPGVVFRSFRVKVHVRAMEGATLSIGKDVFVNDGVNIYASQHVEIGDHALLGDWAMVYDTDFHPVDPSRPAAAAPVRIGRNVWVGARAMILAGADIGDHSVVAAGAVVRGHVPARSVVAGSPARVIRTFDCPDDWVRP